MHNANDLQIRVFIQNRCTWYIRIAYAITRVCLSNVYMKIIPLFSSIRRKFEVILPEFCCRSKYTRERKNLAREKW